MIRCDKSAVQQYRQVWLWLLLWIVFVPGVQAATDCNAVTEIPVSECRSLLDLYNSTNGPNWRNNTGWNQTNTPCSWHGINCSAGHVTEILLFTNGNASGGNGLTGQIPDLNLSKLSVINLEGNQFNGSIPNFSNLPNLQGILLGASQLSGSIPDFSHLPNLMFLSLPYNQLSGNIPNFSNLPNLVQLHLYHNQLSGSIPNFSNLPELERLDLGSNQLSGSIPNFNNLPNLYALDLSSNQLSGNIPNFTTFGLADLGLASFSNNCGLIAYDSTQESVLNSKDPNWQTRNPDCSVIDLQPDIRIEPTTLVFE